MNETLLAQELAELRDRHFLAAVKTGTEVEDMEDEEIAFLRDISASAGVNLPLVVKIGGPEARRDIRLCLRLKVDLILAPMVESVYSLDNFVESARGLCRELTGAEPRAGGSPATNPGVAGGSDGPGGSPAHGHWQPGLAVNIETATALANLDDMLFSRAASWLSQITIGRGDLSKSMHLEVNSPAVMRCTQEIIEKARAWKLQTSVGGGLSMDTIGPMAASLDAGRFNTRHMVFRNTPEFRADAAVHLAAGLRWEQSMYMVLAERVPAKREAYKARIKVLDERLAGKGVV